MEGRAHPSTADGGTDAGGREFRLGVRHVRRDDGRVARLEAEAVAEAIGQRDIVTPDLLDAHVVEQLDGGPGGDPVEPGR